MNSDGKFMRDEDLSQIHEDIQFLVQENQKLTELLAQLQKEKTQFVPSAPTLQIPVQNVSHVPIQVQGQQQYHQQQQHQQQQQQQQQQHQQQHQPQDYFNQNIQNVSPLNPNEKINILPEMIQELPENILLPEKQAQSTYEVPSSYFVSHSPSVTIPDQTKSITIIIDTNKMIYLLLFIILMIIILKK